MVGVVGADAGDSGSVFLDRFLVGGFDELLEVEHYLVQLLDGLVPLLPIKGSEGLVVVAAELGRRLAFEFGQGLRVPEDEMVGELSDGMIALAVVPIGLLGSKPFDRDV